MEVMRLAAVFAILGAVASGVSLQEDGISGSGSASTSGSGSAGLCYDGELRLAGGSGKTAGRVEICFDGVFGTVCDDDWDRRDAEVVCRQLGLFEGPDGSGSGSGSGITDLEDLEILFALPNAAYGPGSDPIYLDDVNCTGGERLLAECDFPGVGQHNCGHGEDASVVCPGGRQCEQGEVRLAGRDSPFTGRVEVCVNGVFGTVCDDDWDNGDAAVVCRQLGFSPTTAQANQAFGGGRGPIFLDELRCQGTEDNLLECIRNRIGQHDCSHSEDAGINCFPIEGCDEGTIRLAGGSDLRGRVEICLNGVFGTVCDDLWDDRDATVVCRQLGFTMGTGIQIFGGGFGPIHLDDVGCDGSENSLTDCPHSGIGIHNCNHFEDAGVDCGGAVVRFVTGNLTVAEGDREEICVQLIQNTLEEDIQVSILPLDPNAQDELQVFPQVQRFLPGETLKCFEFEALKDFTLEETFEDYFLPLSVSSQSTVTVSGPASIRVTILDRDFVIIDAAVPLVDVVEGSVVEACAVRGLDSARIFDRPVVLRVVGFPTGATPGVDFSFDAIIPLVFEFPDDSPIVCRPFEIFQDDIPEPDPESVTLVLQAFDVAIVIPQPFTTFNIIDDDGPPPQPESFFTFVGDTPTVDGTTLTFTIDTSATRVECRLSGMIPCDVGENVVEGLDFGNQVLLVRAFFAAEVVEEERKVYIAGPGECSAILINNGIEIEDGRLLMAEFRAIGDVDVFECRIDRNRLFECQSPLRLNLAGLEAGPHFLRIVPRETVPSTNGPSKRSTAGCEDAKGQTFDFVL